MSFAFLAAALAVLAVGPEQAAKPSALSVCAIDGDPDTYIGRKLKVHGRITDLVSHGLYTYDSDCPDIYMTLVLARKAPDETRARLMAGSRRPGAEDTAPTVIFQARPEMRDYQLPLTDHVSKRLMLVVLSVETVTSPNRLRL